MKEREKYTLTNYWDSLADGMIALLLCILLIVILLTMYLVKDREELVDDTYGDNTEEYADPGQNSAHSHDELYRDPYEGDNWNTENHGDGGGLPETWSAGKNIYGDSARRESETGEKSAVLVQILDGETMKEIRKSHVEFELYDIDERRQVLYDYYPTREECSSFFTDEEGCFYLPEKIHQGIYFLRNLIEAEGYERAEDTSFYLDDYHDWDNPLRVTVKMYPLRNIIRMDLRDTQTGEPLTGAEFQIIAKENITTLDGSIRYRAGEVVDTIVLDGNGYGESQGLYLGHYTVRQTVAPEYYGAIEGETSVTVKDNKTAEGKVRLSLNQSRTTMTVMLTDALYDDIRIEGAEFSLSSEDGIRRESLVTDANGQAKVSDLKKGTTYEIRQEKTQGDYQIDNKLYRFTVDKSGLIDGKVNQTMTIENRIIRVSFSVRDRLLGNQVSDASAVLYDEEGAIVRQWTTAGQNKTLTGISPGEYRLVINGKDENALSIYVSDISGEQVFRYEIWTLTDFTILGSVSMLFIIAFIFFMKWKARRRRMKRRG